MNITYKNIGTEYEKFELYLKEEDYRKLFSEEMAFGKLLTIFEDLAKMISDDPEKLREWIFHDSRHTGVLEVTKEIYKILSNNEE